MNKRTLMAAVVLLGLVAPDHVHSQELTVTLLGTGTPRPDPDRQGAATLVQAGDVRLLFDAGRGVVTQMTRAGIEVSSLTGVFLTHLHSDHVVGLPDLWLLGHVTPWYRSRALQVYGPPGTASLAAGLTQAFAADVELRSNPQRPGPALQSTEISEERVVFARGGVVVTAFPVEHVSESLGYFVEYGGRRVIISGDASPSPRLLALGKGADLLVHEVMAIEPLPDVSTGGPVASTMLRVLATHTTPEQLAEVLSEIEPRATVLTHVSLNGISGDEAVARIRMAYDGHVVMGHDLMVVRVGDTIEVGGEVVPH